MTVEAYTDGAFNAADRKYGSGCVLLIDGIKDPVILRQAGNEEQYLSSRNVAGEVFAAVYAIEFCRQYPGEKVDELVIHYDYAGIECWITGKWRANAAVSRFYVEYAAAAPFKLTFRKVRAHSGDTWNEVADHLAKQACGLL